MTAGPSSMSSSRAAALRCETTVPLPQAKTAPISLLRLSEEGWPNT